MADQSIERQFAQSQFPTLSIPVLRGMAHLVLEMGPRVGFGAGLHLWLEHELGSFMKEGEFWVEVAGESGEPAWWWRFGRPQILFNRGCFSLLEVLPANAGLPPPQGTWLPPSSPSRPQS